MGYGLGTPQDLSKAPPSTVSLGDYGRRETDRVIHVEDRSHCFVWLICICFYFEQGQYRALRDELAAPTVEQASVISVVPY